MAWEDSDKEKAVKLYLERNPTPENSMEIVTEVAEILGQSPNGVRMVLSKAGAYVKKAESTGGPKKASGTAKEGGSTRVSKEDAHAQLISAITDAGGEVDSEIVSKLTGKAAVYLAGVITSINK